MYWQEFEIGLRRESPSRAITPQHLDAFILASGLDLAMFASDEGARAAGHAARVVPGPMVLSVAMGLVQRTGLFDHVVAVLSFEDLRFLSWTHLGDQLRVLIEVLDIAPGNEERGRVVLGFEVRNQQGQTVAQARANYLMQRRPD